MKKASSDLLLLDVNVLLALAWPNHQFYLPATRRLERRATRWATCALTQLGFIRLSSNPKIVGTVRRPGEAASLLVEMTKDKRHVYLGEAPPPIQEPFLQGFAKLLGFKQVTDAYLLALAEKNHATLATFDSRLLALTQAEGSVELLGG